MSHISSKGLYYTVFLSLIALTVITVVVARVDLGAFNTPIALGVAGVKATLVILFFMGVKYNTPLTKVVAASGFVWLIILFGMTMGDYLTRAWLGFPGR
ncbi:MAG: cytochrome C oxidase subunit IV family protein, partial [Acidobacteria bacterium]|jgi:cytochrome c oxidase subunit 4|nr:cytochrome C oxidase subunit IV family protein [Acidobacteriota bacterium]